MNPSRAGQWELDIGELSRVAEILGHPVTQIIALTDPGRLAQIVPSWVA